MAIWEGGRAVGRPRSFLFLVDDQGAGHLSLANASAFLPFLCAMEVLGSARSLWVYANLVRTLGYQLTYNICQWNYGINQTVTICLLSTLSTYLSPSLRWLPHFEHEKQLMWYTKCWMFWLFADVLLFIPFWFMLEVVRITSSFAGITCPQAEHAPVFPNILQNMYKG